MKILERIKKNKLLAVVGSIYLVLLLVSPEKAIASFNNSLYYLKEMLLIVPVIFILIAVIETLIPKEVIVARMGDNSGFTGNLLSLALGSLSAGPIYAAFPIGKALLAKGASISNIVIILSAWAVVKVPMLLNEIKFLGVEFMGVRWILTVLAIFTMAYLASRIVKKEDLPQEEFMEKENSLMVQEAYCIGCGLCVKLAPEFFKLEDNKAVTLETPIQGEDLELVKETVEKCPTNAIRI